MMQGVEDRIRVIEDLISRDVGRGIMPLVDVARGGLLSAARSIAETTSPHVAILTGFFIIEIDPPAPEPDGPVGAAHLAAALCRVGVPTRLVTDNLCLGPVREAARAAGAYPGCPMDVVHIDDVEGSLAQVTEAWSHAETSVSHVLAIERPGRTGDGTYRNSSGEDISSFTAPLDKLFRRGMTRIGIGDGGNEIGMGSIPRHITLDVVNSTAPLESL